MTVGNGGAMKWSTAKLAQGRMRLAAASSGDCALFAGGEVNTTNNDGSGIVDMVNTAACKRFFSLGCVAHTDGAVFQRGSRRPTARRC